MSIDTLSYNEWKMLWMMMAGFFGLAIGSFLNVVIWRIPKKISLISPPSQCTSCKNPISIYDNIPVISYVLLLGKCRKCKHRISVRYPIIELLTAAIFVITVWRVGLYLHTIGLVLFFAGLIALSVIDIDLKLLPKKIVYASGALLVVFYLISSLTSGEYNRLRDAALVGALYSTFLFLVWFASGGKAMGFGDVRLAVFLGIAMGYFGLLIAYFGMLFSFALGSFLGIAIAAITHAGRKMKVPFGPFLAIGTIFAIWFVPQIREWIDIYNV